MATANELNAAFQRLTIAEGESIRAAMEAAVLVERERCAKIAETEEELDGEPPFEMNAESIHVARAIVRATKKSIARRIRAEPKDNGNE